VTWSGLRACFAFSHKYSPCAYGVFFDRAVRISERQR